MLLLKVAIIGCGKIADSHAEQLQRIPGAEIVGVCDREPLMAKQLSDRFPVKAWYTDVDQLLNEGRPDVVHVTTPPQGHFGLAAQCLRSGCHVYVEKPFTIYEREARELIKLANASGLKITAGHDDQFSHVARRMRALIADGYLGGSAVHMESHYCYELGESAYASALLQDKEHWVRRLPGKLLQNIISHGIARIAEHLVTDSPQVTAFGHRSPFLRDRGEFEIVDELRVVIREEEQRTAYFTFSSQMRPSLHQFRIFGPQNGLLLDQDQEVLIRLRGKHRKSYLEKFATPLTVAREYCSNVADNLRTFAKKDFHMKSGLKYLIESFYRSIVDGAPDPIPYREIILASAIMEDIFNQLTEQCAKSSHDRRLIANLEASN